MFFKDYVVKQIYTLFIIIFIQHSLGPDLIYNYGNCVRNFTMKLSRPE